MLTTLPLLNPNWLSLGFFKSSERSSWGKYTKEQAVLQQVPPATNQTPEETKHTFHYCPRPLVGILHSLDLCYLLQRAGPHASHWDREVTLGQRWVQPHNNRKEVFVIPSHGWGNSGQRAHKASPRSRGWRRQPKSASLFSSVFFWQYPTFPSLPSRWFLWLHPFCLGLLHVGGDRHPRLRAPLPLSRAVCVLWLLILYWEAQESSC